MTTYASYKPFYDSIWKRMENPSDTVRGVRVPKKYSPDADSAWLMASISEEFHDVSRDIRSIKLQPNDDYLIGPHPYIPYGDAPITTDNKGLTEANALLQATFARKQYFNGNRIDVNFKRIIQDYFDNKTCINEGKEAFSFVSFPLLLPKGSEGPEIFNHYKTLGIMRLADFNSRAVRDYYFSCQIFMFLRGFDIVNLSVCASALCLTTCVDYVGTMEDPKMGGIESYLAASIDSTKVQGSRFPPEMDELIMVAALMQHKNDLLASCKAGKM